MAAGDTPLEVMPNSKTIQGEAGSDYPVTGNSSIRSGPQHDEESWWDKLKHIFGAGEGEGQTVHADPIDRQQNSDSRKFGTGEGHLELDDVPSRSMRSNPFYYS
jgi:hypothetical protein